MSDTRPLSAVVEELIELEAKATPGEWHVEYQPDDLGCDTRTQVLYAGHREVCRMDDDMAEIAGEARFVNLPLISAMRNALPRLLTRLQALEAVAEAGGALLLDVADYPAWQRPCHAVDVLVAALDNLKATEGHNG